MDLIERLEKAEVGSRELDYLIHGAIKGWRLPTEEHSFTFWIGDSFQYGSPDKERLAIYIKEYELPDYTTSLDAALSLGRTPSEQLELVRLAVSAIGRKHHLHVRVFDGDARQELARAICVEALRARQSQESGRE